MKKKIIASSLALIALVCAFYIGYTVGRQQNDPAGPPQDDPNRSIRSRWVDAAEPPLPEITIGDKPIKVARSAYSWCSPQAACTSVDASIPELTAVAVPAGSKIGTKAPEGIKEFTLINTSDNANGDPYFVPKAKGTYVYRIHCEWFLDQGEADYYFSVEVA